jgi:hypothetical protein
MKKKKPPVVLASTLIVLVGLAVILFPKSQDPSMPPQPPPKTAEDVVPTGKSRSTPSKSEIKSQQKSAESRAGAMRQAPEEGPQATLANSANPTIFIPRYNATKQTPNDASVQGQWYRPDARASNKEGFK